MKLSHVSAFLAGVLLALVGGIVLRQDRAAAVSISSTVTSAPTMAPVLSLTPRLTSTSIPTAIPSPTAMEVAAATPGAQLTAAGGLAVGWPGQVQCWNCSPFSVRVKLSSYNPQNFDPEYPRLNCWEFSEKFDYCLSPTWIGVPWDAVWGIGAACAGDWAIGSWVEIPEVGSFICFDHGEGISCDEKGLCRVDLLGPGGADWDGKEFDATLWVPTSYLLRIQGK